MNADFADHRAPLVATLALPQRALGQVREDVANLLARRRRTHPAMVSGAHNPWGYAGQLLDSWSVLELCESGAVLDLVEDLIGPDIVLWDSSLWLPMNRAADLRWLKDEWAFWPADPLAGASVLLDLSSGQSDAATQVAACDIHALRMRPEALSAGLAAGSPGLCIRYMPATSLFNRGTDFAANRTAALREPLINYANRPIWLVRGEDRAGSDFVTGFKLSIPSWAPL